MQTASACVCAALEAQGRPVCECYSTIGQPMAAVCCECEPGVTGEVSIRFEQMYDADPNTFEQVSRVRPCRNGVTVAEFVVTLYRCYPTLTEAGEVPDPVDQSERAAELNRDASILWQAITCCEGLSTAMGEMRADTDPQGGCSELTLRFVAEVSALAGLVSSP